MQPDTGKVFGHFGVRLVAVGLDFVLILFAVGYAQGHISRFVDLSFVDHRVISSAGLFLYFMACWASPLRASLAQMILGLRVVAPTGERLSLGRAAIRSAVLVVAIAGCYLLFRIPPEPIMVALALLAYAALFSAAVTPLRQSAHDFAAQSIVVTRSGAANLPIDGVDKPSVLNIAGNFLVLALPVFALVNMALIMNDRDMLFRTNYAVTETADVQAEVEAYYQFEGIFPASADALGVPLRRNYPDGGYFEVTERGIIRIHFEIRPELKDGTIVLTPLPRADGIEWRCRAQGAIRQHHLPSRCRDQ